MPLGIRTEAIRNELSAKRKNENVGLAGLPPK